MPHGGSMLLFSLLLACATEPVDSTASDDTGSSCVETFGEVDFLLTEEDTSSNRPVSGNILVTDAQGEELWLITDENGEVSMQLEAGAYTGDSESTYCVAETVHFTVEPCGSHFVEVVLGACLG